MNLIKIPDLSLVVLVGSSGSGKSSFARKHFKLSEILSSDECRKLVCDDQSNQSVTKEAFEVLNFIASKRLTIGRLTVIDATNINEGGRRSLLDLAHTYHYVPIAIVFNLPEEICQKRNLMREDRRLDPHIIHQQNYHLKQELPKLEREGFKHIFILNSVEEVNAVLIERQRMQSDLKYDKGPFDIIGDIHGCFEELCQLLQQLGYRVEQIENNSFFNVIPPTGRKLIFLGDLVDRGPNAPDVLKLVMDMVEAGNAYCVAGNHDMKLLRKLKGAQVKISHGLLKSLEQLEKQDPAFIERIIQFLEHLANHYHYVLDEGKLVIAHAGLKEEFQGRSSGKVRAFALYGSTEGKCNEQGLPIREPWSQKYRGKAMVVYGHTPVLEPWWTNHTINIDTGCVFGGKLTALRYPELELVSVPAMLKYAESIRPFETLLDDTL